VPPLAWFSAAEYADRCARAREGMAGAGLDALWLTAESNYTYRCTYLSGHQTGMFAIRSRPLSLLLPRDGEAALAYYRRHKALIDARLALSSAR
jgi:hypothetical protein